MIDQKELAKVREINRNLPFAHPIEQTCDPQQRVYFAPAGTFSMNPVAGDLAGWVDVTDAIVPGSLSFTHA